MLFGLIFDCFLNRVRQMGRVLFTRPGFFLSVCRNECGDVFLCCGCLLLFSDVQFSFLFCRLCTHTCSCCISLLNKRGASSEHAIANFVSVLLSRRGKLYAVNFTAMGKV